MELSQDNGKVKTEYTFILAVIIVIAYVIFFGVVMHQDQSPYEGLKTITATFGIIVATVVGYYFGQRPAEAAQQHAREATSQNVETKTKLDSDVKEDIQLIGVSQERYRKQNEDDKHMVETIDKLLQEL
jgi:hypothetical protein